MIRKNQNSGTRTRTQVARVRTAYPNQLDYSGVAIWPIHESNELNEIVELMQNGIKSMPDKTQQFLSVLQVDA